VLSLTAALPCNHLACSLSQPKLFDTRKTVVITGASSGLGRATTEVLAKTGKWHVIMVRSHAGAAPARCCVRKRLRRV